MTHRRTAAPTNTAEETPLRGSFTRAGGNIRYPQATRAAPQSDSLVLVNTVAHREHKSAPFFMPFLVYCRRKTFNGSRRACGMLVHRPVTLPGRAHHGQE